MSNSDNIVIENPLWPEVGYLVRDTSEEHRLMLERLPHKERKRLLEGTWKVELTQEEVTAEVFRFIRANQDEYSARKLKQKLLTELEYPKDMIKKALEELTK